jgi:hypothetical protein
LTDPRIRVGADVVTRRGDTLEVRTRREMDDWEVRKYGRTGIVFRGTTYVTRSLARNPKGGVVYVLEPWSRARHDSTPKRIVYDEDYVHVRDLERAAGGVAGALRIPLLLLSPLLGFLPSAAKRGLHTALGIEPRFATRWSVYLEFAVLILAGFFLAVLGFASAAGGLFAGGELGPVAGMLSDPITVLLTIIAVIGLDLMGRGGSVIRGEMDQYGFYEWAWRPLLRLLRRGN